MGENDKTDVWQGTLLVWRPRSHARARAALVACGLLVAALSARRRPHAGGGACRG
jgi:hypothetical protein